MDNLLQYAQKIAINSELLHKHCSILYCDDQLFSGYNHFSYNNKGITIHAEEDAINNYITHCRKKYCNDMYIRKKLHKAILITIRIKNNSIKNSAPCNNCIEIIKSYGIKQIIYSDINTEHNNILVQKKIRDVKNRPSSGHRWRQNNNNKSLTKTT